MRKLTSQDFIKAAREIHGRLYDYALVDYKLARLKVEIICPYHGVWEQRPNDHLKGNGCPNCKFKKIADLKRGNKDSFMERAVRIHGRVYDYSRVNYANAITKVEIVCPHHGSFFQTPDKHTSGKTGCPKCSNGISRGEKEIMKILDAANVIYEREKRFNGLCGTTSNSRLKYDFWLPEYNLLIEYDGEHHFMPVRTKGRLSQLQAEKNYTRTKINDKKKDKYAHKHGYRLLRIRYDENLIHVITSKLFPTQ